MKYEQTDPKRKAAVQVDLTEAKHTRKRTIYITAILTAVISVLLTAGGMICLFRNYQEVVESNTFSKNELSQIETVFNTLKSGYVNSDITKQQLLDGALKGMAEAVDDPYTNYLVEDETSQIDQTLTGSFGGIGAELMNENNAVIISTPMEGSPSMRAGLQSGDVITKVDGVDVSGKSTSEVVKLVRGEIGTKVVLTVYRGTVEIEVPITREKIDIVTVKGNIDTEKPTVGVIKISSFAANTTDELKKVVEDLRSKGATSFVIDLRNNPGGLLDQALKIASMFLKNGETVVKVADRQGKTTSFKASDKYSGDFKISEPYVVLINESSASAAEILAAALKDSGQAPVLGVTSFGKGTVQSVETISTGRELKYTNAKWYTPNDEWIHKKGVPPTIEVKLPDYAFLTIIDTRETEVEGNVSDNVKNIESILSALGYSVTADGYFDSQTSSAVKEFQAQKELDVTGDVDSSTGEALLKEIRQKILANDTQYKAAIEELAH